MSYRSNLPTVEQQIQQAIHAGLLAAGDVVQAEVKQRLGRGYTSGRFTTGATAASVERSDVQEDERGAFVLVGTDEPSALMWEVGAFSAYTRRFERVPVWMPALLETRSRQLAAFARAFRQVLPP